MSFMCHTAVSRARVKPLVESRLLCRHTLPLLSLLRCESDSERAHKNITLLPLTLPIHDTTLQLIFSKVFSVVRLVGTFIVSLAHSCHTEYTAEHLLSTRTVSWDSTSPDPPPSLHIFTLQLLTVGNTYCPETIRRIRGLSDCCPPPPLPPPSTISFLNTGAA